MSWSRPKLGAWFFSVSFRHLCCSITVWQKICLFFKEQTTYPNKESPSCFIINSSIGSELIKTLRKETHLWQNYHSNGIPTRFKVWPCRMGGGGGDFSWNNYDHSRSFSKGRWLLVSITELQPTDHISAFGRIFRLYRQSKTLRQTLDDSKYFIQNAP